MKIKHISQPVLIVIGIIVGCIGGILFKEKATFFSPLGDIFLNLLFTLVVPLVFFSMASAVSSMMNMKRLGKILGATTVVFIITGIIAGLLILWVVHIFPPAQGTSIALSGGEIAEAKTLGEILVSSLTVKDFPLLWSRQAMLPLIFFSILFGVAVSLNGGSDSPLGRLLEQCNNVMTTLITFVMWYAPIGLAAYFATLIGQFGSMIVKDYARALFIYYPLCIIYLVIFFPLYAWIAGGKIGLRRMIENIVPPAVTAFATGSSIATLPANMKACEKIGVPKDIREIVLPLGATAHMDGSVLSGILKISFLYGVYGLPFSGISTWSTALLVAILSAFVLSGAPGGGMVGELLIINLFGFPPEAFPLVATIGFIVDQPATCVNAAGDTLASMLVTRIIDGKDWIKQKN